MDFAGAVLCLLGFDGALLDFILAFVCGLIVAGFI
jgi:hypothetical protein